MSRRLFTIKEERYVQGILDKGFPRRDGIGVLFYDTIEDACRTHPFSGPGRTAGSRYVALEVDVDGLEAKPKFPMPGDVSFIEWVVWEGIDPDRIVAAYLLPPGM